MPNSPSAAPRGFHPRPDIRAVTEHSTPSALRKHMKAAISTSSKEQGKHRIRKFTKRAMGPARQHHIQERSLIQGLGLLQSVALNMSNMIGIGPFITIPLIIGAMGGPQCMLGWALGAILAMCDGLVWSELSAAMPGTGGTYVYLKRSE